MAIFEATQSATNSNKIKSISVYKVRDAALEAIIGQILGEHENFFIQHGIIEFKNKHFRKVT